MISLFDALKVGAGAMIGASLMLIWAVHSYGPDQYAAGGLATAAKLDAATNAAAKDLANEADRARFLRRQCAERGGVYQFADGRCVE